MVANTASLTAEHAHAVCFIHHDAGIIFFFQLHDFRQWSQVAFHRKDTIHDDELHRFRVALLQFLFQGFHIVVLILQLGSERESASVHDGSVVAVIADDVVLAVYQGRDNALVHGESGSEYQTIFLAKKSSQFFFQLYVKVERSVQETRTGASGTIFAGSCNSSFDDTLVVGQAHIGIGAEHQYFLSVHHHFGILRTVDFAEIRIDTHRHVFLRLSIFAEFFL